MEARGPPDYDREAEEELARLMAKAVVRIGSVHTGNGTFNRWILGAAMALFVAGVGALAGVEYSVVQRLAILETKVDILLIRK